MNVEVLGDDICYGASHNTVFRKQSRLGDDELLGFDFGSFGKGIVKIGKSAVSIFKTPTGKAVGSATLTALAGRMTPTQKAQVAKAQEIAGVSPQWVPGSINIVPPPPPEDQFKKNMPYIIGGVALLGLAFIVMKKR